MVLNSRRILQQGRVRFVGNHEQWCSRTIFLSSNFIFHRNFSYEELECPVDNYHWQDNKSAGSYMSTLDMGIHAFFFPKLAETVSACDPFLHWWTTCSSCKLRLNLSLSSWWWEDQAHHKVHWVCVRFPHLWVGWKYQFQGFCA